jgi:hypothetical protein
MAANTQPTLLLILFFGPFFRFLFCGCCSLRLAAAVLPLSTLPAAVLFFFVPLFAPVLLPADALLFLAPALLLLVAAPSLVELRFFLRACVFLTSLSISSFRLIALKPFLSYYFSHNYTVAYVQSLAVYIGFIYTFSL